MLIKGQNPSNIKFGNTFTVDGLEEEKFDYMLSNPPFGVDWKKAEKIIKAAGCHIRCNNENKKEHVLEISGDSISYCLEICKIAYFYWWTKMLAIRIDGRFQMLAADHVLKAEEAIIFFFNGINHVLPKFQYFRYGEFKYPSFSCFSYLLGKEVVKGTIESKDDIRRLLSKLSDEIGMLMKKFENSKNYDFELAEELKNDLIRFSNDKLICKHIYQGIHETISLDGIPNLTFEKL